MTDDLLNFADDAADEIEQARGIERFGDAVLYGTDWTVGTIIQQMEAGNIDITPDFQRRDAWDPKKKSRFIESVALSLPIPQIVLAERKEQRGTYIILDGKQRLLTLAQFAADLDPDHDVVKESRSQKPLKLTGLEILSELNGKTYKDIEGDPRLRKILTQFENHTIRSSLIRNWPDEDYLYEVFIRLNTGSTKLSPQELRQALKPGAFTEYVVERSSSSKQLQAVLGISGPDFRMRDVELLLRLIAFSTRLHEYRGNLKRFLDETLDEFNSNWESSAREIEARTKAIEDALESLEKIFGSPQKVGRRWMNEGYESAVNRAILDFQVAYMLHPKNRAVILSLSPETIEMAFKQLCETNREFIEAISATTKTATAIKNRHLIWEDLISKLANQQLIRPPLPR